MSEAVSRRHTIAANLLWFACMFVLASLAMSTLATFAMTSLQGLGVPFLSSILMAVGAFAIAAFVAGNRFADLRRAEVRQKRLALALSYTLLGGTLSFAVPALLIGSLLIAGATMSPEVSHSLVGTILRALVTTAVMSPINFVIAWIVLGRAIPSREAS